MSSIKVLVASCLMVVGSLSANADTLEEPRFFEYKASRFINRLAEASFGWFKTLDNEQRSAYHSSIIHAVMYSDNGQTVRWYVNNASGEVTPVSTIPSGNGYCRRIHVQTVAYGVQKTVGATACFNDSDNTWKWFN
jgi:surface antigen